MSPRFSLLALVMPLAVLAFGCDAVGMAAGSNDMERRILAAKDGETITIPPGNYPRITLRDVVHDRPITVRMNGVVVAGMDLTKISGFRFVGGTVDPADFAFNSINLTSVHDVSLTGMTISGGKRGVVVSRGDTIAITDSKLTGLRSDGIDLGRTRKIVVRGNACSNFSPIKDTFVNGQKASNGDHPDCVQAWSRPTDPPVADVVVENNVAEGDMQGIFFGNHVRNGVDDGGFDRIVIRNNHIRISRPPGISLGGGRNSVVTGNVVQSIPGSTLIRNGARVNTNLIVTGTANVVCGNRVPDVPRNPANLPCK